MDPDVLLTTGIVLVVLSIPTLLSAWVDGRAPRMGAILAVAGLGLILTALYERPGGYMFNQVPGVMIEVFARLLR